jgi:hypothetical protein
MQHRPGNGTPPTVQESGGGVVTFDLTVLAWFVGTWILLTAALLVVWRRMHPTVDELPRAHYWHVQPRRLIDWERQIPEWRPLRLVVDPEQWDEYLQVPRNHQPKGAA